MYRRVFAAAALMGASLIPSAAALAAPLAHECAVSWVGDADPGRVVVSVATTDDKTQVDRAGAFCTTLINSAGPDGQPQFVGVNKYVDRDLTMKRVCNVNFSPDLRVVVYAGWSLDSAQLALDACQALDPSGALTTAFV